MGCPSQLTLEQILVVPQLVTGEWDSARVWKRYTEVSGTLVRARGYVVYSYSAFNQETKKSIFVDHESMK